MAGWIPRVLVFVAALTLAADFGFAQDKPDFSGSWILASGPSDADVPKALSIQQPLVRTNRRGEPVTPYFFDMTVARTQRREVFSLTSDGGLRIEMTFSSLNADRRTIVATYRRE